MFGASEYLQEESMLRASSDAERELINECDYFLFRMNVPKFVTKYHSSQTRDSWDLFCRKIEKYGDFFDKSEQLILLQTALPCLRGLLEKNSLAHFLKSAVNIKSRFGLRLFVKLFTATASLPTHSLTTYSAISELLIALKNQAEVVNEAVIQLPDLSSTLASLRLAHERFLHEKYPQRDLDMVLSEFANQSELVAFPLSHDELTVLKQEFIDVRSFLLAMNDDSFAELKQRAKEASSRLSLQEDDHAKYELIAVMTRMIRFFYSITPHDTQVLSLLALLKSPEQMKGRIAQIGTGEGKSTIIALLAGFLANQGHFVDIVTSDGYLAARDAKKYARFYKSIGLTSSHICWPMPGSDDCQGQILYGKHTDFEFAYLHDGLNSRQRQSFKKGTLQPRAFDVAIIDEVDNLLFDTALNAAILSINSNNNDHWIYDPIYEAMKRDRHLTKEELRTQLASMQFGEYKDRLEQIDDTRLTKLMESAISALYEKHENDDYIVQKKWLKKLGNQQHYELTEIIIVDKENTGRLMHGQKWKHGLHQFLQLKHGAAPDAETHSAASVSHQVYFNLYQHLYGVTGTMGELVERSEVENVYSISSFDVPPRFPCQRVQQAISIQQDENQQFAAMISKLRMMRTQGKPSLVLFKSIRDSNAFSRYLADRHITHQLLNEMQQQDEDYILSCAGDAGQITVATNTAARGADVLLSPESILAGGLHFIFGFYPNTIRVEKQGNGRAGRQGQPGTCEMILHLGDSSIKPLLTEQEPQTTESILEHLKTARTRRVHLESFQRMMRFESEHLLFKRLQDFFSNLREIRQLFDTEEFKAEFLARCDALDENRQLEITLDDSWSLVIEYAETLIKNATVPIDWSALQHRFKQQYIQYAQNKWAKMYSNVSSLDSSDQNLLEQLEALDQFNQNMKSALYLTLDAILQQVSSVRYPSLNRATF